MKQFQFPTGWNSTRRRAPSRQAASVSIPNGMEFYLMRRLAPRRGILSFNSQRDGILPFQRSLGCAQTKVSIPNGMEFYSHSQAWHNLEHCFNSQRDGILQKAALIAHAVARFQFPTGWNST